MELRRMIRLSYLVTSFALFCTAAFGGSLDDPVIASPTAPIVAPPTESADWTGFYFGGQLLTGQGDDDTTDFDVSGFGGHAGYLYDLGDIVVGGEVDYDTLDLESGGVELDARTARLKAVAGYDLGNFLPYVAAGIADVEIEAVGGDLQDQIGFYGLGGSYQLNDSFRVGAEYLIHEGTDFDNSGFNVDIETLSLRGSFSF